MRLTKDQWSRHVSAWRKSGSTAKEYCESRGLKVRTFRYWSGRIRRESAEALNEAFGEAPRFAKVRTVKAERRGSSDDSPKAKPEAPKAPNTSGVRVVMGKVAVEVGDTFDAETLRRVLEVLGATGGAR